MSGIINDDGGFWVTRIVLFLAFYGLIRTVIDLVRWIF